MISNASHCTGQQKKLPSYMDVLGHKATHLLLNEQWVTNIVMLLSFLQTACDQIHIVKPPQSTLGTLKWLAYAYTYA